MNKVLHNGKEYISRTQAAEVFKIKADRLRYLEKTRGLERCKIPNYGFTTFYEYNQLLKVIKNEN